MSLQQKNHRKKLRLYFVFMKPGSLNHLFVSCLNEGKYFMFGNARFSLAGAFNSHELKSWCVINEKFNFKSLEIVIAPRLFLDANIKLLQLVLILLEFLVSLDGFEEILK